MLKETKLFEGKCKKLVEDYYENYNNWNIQTSTIIDDYKRTVFNIKKQGFYLFIYGYIFTGFDNILKQFTISIFQSKQFEIRFGFHLLSTILSIGFIILKFINNENYYDYDENENNKKHKERKKIRKIFNYIEGFELVYIYCFIYFRNFTLIFHKSCSNEYKSFCFGFENFYLLFLIYNIQMVLFHLHMIYTQYNLLEEDFLRFKTNKENICFQMLDTVVKRNQENEKREELIYKRLKRLKRQLE